MGDDHFLTPVMYLSSVDRHQGRSGPTPEAGCYCQRIGALQPLAPLLGEEHDVDLLRWLLDTLATETGLGFRGPAADALRGIEVFHLPSFDDHERSLVRVLHAPQESNVCTVTIEDESADFLVQVSAHVLGDRVFDCIGEPKGSPPAVRFELPWPIDDRIVRVWRRSQKNESWVLWHEEDRHLIRTIRTNMGVVGLTGKVKSDWVAKLAGTRAAARAGEYMKFQQVHSQPMVTSSRAPWERAAISAREEGRRLFPAESGAKFFPKGWEGESKLDLAEWLKNRLSKHAGKVVFLDPYFDEPAIDLVCRVSGAAKSIAVLTCTQIKSDDDSENQPSRDERIRRSCRQLGPVLQGIGLLIFDLKSTGGGARALFHDRYLIVFDEADRPTSGYHLSNSLQGATRTSPLLVTPIPQDTLPSVSDYVSDLLAPTDSTTLEQLYPPKQNAPRRAAEVHETACAQLLAFASVLHRRNDYEQQPCPDPCKRLVELGLLEEGRTRILWDDSGTTALANFFRNVGTPDASTVWCGLAESLARDNAALEGLTQLVLVAGDALGDFVERYLIEVPKGNVATGYLASDRIATTTLAHVFDCGFLRGLDLASSLCGHLHSFDETNPWSLKYATRLLVDTWPHRVDDLVAKFSTEDVSAQPLLSSVVSALVASVQERENNLLDLFRARCDFLRAFAAVSEWHLVREGALCVDRFLDNVHLLNEMECRQALARAVYDLRVETNRRHGDDSTVSHLRAQLLNALLSTYRAPTTSQDAGAIVRLLSGPLPGSAARSTSAEFLDPLVEHGHLNATSAFEIWQSVLRGIVTAENADYFESRDRELLDVWGEAFWRTTEDRRAKLLRRAIEELPKRSGVLRQAFLRSRNYDLWRENANAVLWWLLALDAAETARPDGITDPSLTEAVAGVRAVIKAECLTEFAVGQLVAVAKLVMNR